MEGRPYTIDGLMACLLASELQDRMVSTVGSNTPLSMVAYLLATKTHAPHAVLIPFCGLNDIPAYPITLSLAEVFAYKHSTSHWAIEDLWEWIYQKSLTSVEFGSTAQMDRGGRINNSIIGSPERIKVRLPGQAGLADVFNLHHHAFVYITRQDSRRLVEQVDFISGARYFVTEAERTKMQLPDGNCKLVTNLGVFLLDRTKRSLVLTHLHPGVSVEEMQQHTGFPLDISDDLQVTQPPAKEQLHLIRRVIDPLGFRKLEFASGSERSAQIQAMLEKEERVVLGRNML